MGLFRIKPMWSLFIVITCFLRSKVPIQKPELSIRWVTINWMQNCCSLELSDRLSYPDTPLIICLELWCQVPSKCPWNIHFSTNPIIFINHYYFFCVWLHFGDSKGVDLASDKITFEIVFKSRENVDWNWLIFPSFLFPPFCWSKAVTFYNSKRSIPTLVLKFISHIPQHFGYHWVNCAHTS